MRMVIICMAELIHCLFYTDFLTPILTLPFFVCVNSSPRIALPLPRRTILSFGERRRSAFNTCSSFTVTAPEVIACAAAERERDNISPATASSRGDATVMHVSFIFNCGART